MWYIIKTYPHITTAEAFSFPSARFAELNKICLSCGDVHAAKLFVVGAFDLGRARQVKTFSQQGVHIAFWQIIWQISSMKLTAVIYPDTETDWLVAECPEIGTASQGKTEEEALANLREATELYLESFPRALKKESAVRSFELAHA